MRPVPAEIERFRAFAERRFGLAFEDGKLTLLGEVLAHQAKATGCRTVSEYLDRCLERNGLSEEPDRLVEQLTVGETYFFRNQDQFRVLSEVAVPARLAARGGARKLRLLSAGCASGEEPYSMAICLRESVPDLASWDLDILGVDINAAALERAAAGRYSGWSFRETPDVLRERYFQRLGKQSFRLDPTVQRMVRFARCNLNHPDPECWHPGEIDLIFCRNVLMYFSPAAARALVARLAKSLAPDGFLFLGTAETLRGLSGAFHLRHSHRTFYYQLRETELGDAAACALPALGPPDASFVMAVEQARQRIEQLALHAEGRRADAGAPSVPLERAGDTDALLLQAVELTNQSRPAQAEAICRQILLRDELNAGAHYLMAICRENAGDRAAATDHDQYALYLDPSFAMPRLHLGLMARRADQYEVARRELGEALVLLAREDAARIVLLGGGFTRDGLLALCRAELRACGGET